MAEKIFKNRLQHAIFAHFETFRKHFDESKPPKDTDVWYQKLVFSLYINITKNLENFL